MGKTAKILAKSIDKGEIYADDYNDVLKIAEMDGRLDSHEQCEL